LGSYRGISREVRRAVAQECERFVHDHIERGLAFAVETTMRTTAAIVQAQAMGLPRASPPLPVTVEAATL